MMGKLYNLWLDAKGPPKGFTLVEVMVTLILAVVTAGIILSVLYMSTSEIREGSANFSMEKLYDIVSYNIGWKVREARAVLESGDSYANRGAIAAKNNVYSVITYDNAGNPTGGFRVNTSSWLLEEDTAGTGNWQTFKAGKDTVRLVSGSRFFVDGGGKGLGLHLTFNRISKETLIKFQPGETGLDAETSFNRSKGLGTGWNPGVCHYSFFRCCRSAHGWGKRSK